MRGMRFAECARTPKETDPMRNLLPLFFVFAACGNPVSDSSQTDDSLKKGKCHTNADCNATSYCKKDDGHCKATGTCTSRGINLFCFQLVKPVCGCDGETYTNSCYAQKAGASIASNSQCACDYKGANIDGDTLAEQPWSSSDKQYVYTFTGNGTVDNTSGTFSLEITPLCRMQPPYCAIATRLLQGQFFTYDTTVELDYDNGSVAYFDAEIDCKNDWRLVGNDQGQALTLVVASTLP
jgi:hypothetical protein